MGASPKKRRGWSLVQALQKIQKKRGGGIVFKTSKTSSGIEFSKTTSIEHQLASIFLKLLVLFARLFFKFILKLYLQSKIFAPQVRYISNIHLLATLTIKIMHKPNNKVQINKMGKLI